MSPAPRPFLTARWEHLVVASFAVPEPLLRPHLPPGTEFDRRAGECVASLVGFLFLRTRVFGVGWPWHRDFAEWNLRFYVRRGDTRGVCFVREFVPKPIVSTIARVIYNEPYRVAKVRGEIAPDPVTATYTVPRGGRTHTLTVTAGGPAAAIVPGSDDDFFLNQAWGYGTGHRGALLRYEVTHPAWDVFPVREFKVDVDWGKLYGPEWAGMTGAPPVSVAFARGSEVSVSPQTRA